MKIVRPFGLAFFINWEGWDFESPSVKAFGGEDRKSAVRKAMSQMNCIHLTDLRGRGS